MNVVFFILDHLNKLIKNNFVIMGKICVFAVINM